MQYFPIEINQFFMPLFCLIRAEIKRHFSKIVLLLFAKWRNGTCACWAFYIHITLHGSPRTSPNVVPSDVFFQSAPIMKKPCVCFLKICFLCQVCFVTVSVSYTTCGLVVCAAAFPSKRLGVCCTSCIFVGFCDRLQICASCNASFDIVTYATARELRFCLYTFAKCNVAQVASRLGQKKHEIPVHFYVI